MTMRNILTKIPACAAFVVLLTSMSSAQSAFEDAKGESSVFLKEGGGFARINATDKSIELGFLRDHGNQHPYIGIDLKGKSSGDFASLFNGGTPSTEAEVGLTVGKRFFFLKSDAAIVKKCRAETEANLIKSDLPRLIRQAEASVISGFEQTRLPQLTEEVAAKIRATIIEEAKAKGLSELTAKGIAAELAPRLAETEARKLFEAEARAKVEAEAATIRADAIRSAREESPGFCLLEDPDLERRSVDWLSFRVAYKRSRYKLLHEGASFADQIRKQNFDGFSATLAYNRLITLDDLSGRRARRLLTREARMNLEQQRQQQIAPGDESRDRSKGSMIVGFSIGVRRKNNADDLDSVEVEDQSFTSSSGTTQRRALSKQTVLSGEYKEFISVPLNTDVVWYPGALRSRIAIDFFTRSDLSQTGREFVPGVGLFLTKEGKPTKVVGGISFALDDGKGRVGLVGGFHF